MHQILHIFRKDLRRFWPEALTCLVITAAFARLYPAQWVDVESVRLNLFGHLLPPTSLETLAGVVTALVPISWFVLILRLVQDECLVGERPYWFTRPYEWPKLLAAKLLFITAFVLVPIVVAQVFLLYVAGFSPSQHLGGLALLLLFVAGGMVLPMLCLAVVTRNFLRASLTLLGASAILIGTIGPLSDYLDSVYLPTSDYVSFPLLLLVGCAVLVSQYASRRTWLARSVLIAALVTITLIGVLPTQKTTLERVYYTAPQASIPVEIELENGTTVDKRPAITPDSEDKRELLTIPVAIANVPYGFWVIPDNARLVLTASDGTTTTAGWVSTYNHVFRLGTQEAAFSFKIDKRYLERARHQPVSLQLSLALTQWEAGTSTHYAMPAIGALHIPGFGICANVEGRDHPNAALRCRYPLHQPTRTLVTADVTQQPCPTPPATPLETFPENAIAGEVHPDPSEFGLTSVWDSTLTLGYQNKTDSDASANAHICPGANVSLTPYHVVRRAVYTVSAHSVSIPTSQER